MRTAVRAFTDPQSYGSSLQAAELHILPTRRGRFRGSLALFRLDHVWMSRGQESLPRIMLGAMSAERAVIGFLSDADQPAKYHCGIEVPPGTLIVNGLRPIHRRTEAACRWGAVSIDRATFAAVSEAVSGRPYVIPPDGQIIRPHPLPMARLLDLHQRFDRFAAEPHESHSLSEVVRAVESEMLHVMARCLEGEPSEPRSLTGREHAKIISRFEMFLAENIRQPIYLNEICATTGASERTLRRCCHEHLGMGPGRYLWLRRMHLARNALLETTPKTASVTQIAMDHGFWELGRFATQYRSLFGETPSATLSRGPEHHSVTCWENLAEFA